MTSKQTIQRILKSGVTWMLLCLDDSSNSEIQTPNILNFAVRKVLETRSSDCNTNYSTYFWVFGDLCFLYRLLCCLLLWFYSSAFLVCLFCCWLIRIRFFCLDCLDRSIWWGCNWLVWNYEKFVVYFIRNSIISLSDR